MQEQQVTDVKFTRVKEEPVHVTLLRVVATPKVASQELPKMHSIVPFLHSELNEPPPRKLHTTKNTHQCALSFHLEPS